MYDFKYYVIQLKCVITMNTRKYKFKNSMDPDA